MLSKCKVSYLCINLLNFLYKVLNLLNFTHLKKIGVNLPIISLLIILSHCGALFKFFYNIDASLYTFFIRVLCTRPHLEMSIS
jgi:hypothetical protein